MTEAVAPERKARSWRGPLVSLLVLLAALVAAETGARIMGEGYSSGEARLEIEGFTDAMIYREGAAPTGGEREELRVIEEEGMSMIPHPFFGFDFLHRQEALERDSDYFARGKGETGFEVLILGGSVAAGFRDGGVERLFEKLGEDPRFRGRRLKDLVYARGSGKQPQQLNTLTYLLSMGFTPDAVINLDGFNEVALANTNRMNGVHPLHPAYRYWLHLTSAQVLDSRALDHLLDMKRARGRAAALRARALAWGLHHSALLGRRALSQLREARNSHHEAYDAYTSHLASLEQNTGVTGPGFSDDFDATMQLAVRSWAEGSAHIQAVCEAAGIYYLHVLQPTLHDEGAKPATPREMRVGRTGRGWLDAASKGYPLLRTAGGELRRRGVNFFDASMIFRDVTEDLYYDACHFDQRGNELLAEQMAAAFLAGLP